MNKTFATKQRYHIMRRLIFITCFFFMISACKKEKTEIYTVVYEVEFVGEWSETTHPSSFPSNAHFSSFVAVSHLPNVQLFTVGLNASEGLQQLAETGLTNQFEQEVDALLNASLAVDKVVANTFLSPGQSNKIQIGVRKGGHTITALSMVAPSPDWFVATRTNLLDPVDGEWYDEVVSYVVTYDAGTDSGLSYTANDVPTLPREPIRYLTDGPLSNGSDTVSNMGYFKFVRIQ